MQNPNKRNTRKWLLIFLPVCLLCSGMLWAGNLGYHAARLYNNLDEIQTLAGEELGSLDMAKSGELLQSTAADLGALRNGLRPFFPIMRGLGGLPKVGPYLAQAGPLLEYASGLATAGEEVYLALAPVITAQNDPNQQEQITVLLYQTLSENKTSFERASQAMSRAAEGRTQINPTELPGAIQVLYRQVDPHFETVQSGIVLLTVMPELLGSRDEPQHYLLLAQNRDELRASGGFISAMGLLEVAEAQVLGFTMQDSYDIDDFEKGYPPPPRPLQEFMLAGYWVPRDANWSPDFPSAARQTQLLYTLSTEIETDGVIAFDQKAVQVILGVTGPIEIAGFPETVSADNVEALMQQAWAPAPNEELDEAWWEHRKDFIGQMGKGLLEHILQMRELQSLLGLAKELLKAIEEGHVLIYLNNPEGQGGLQGAGWDGGLHPGGGDFLMVVDSNIGFNKTDAVIQRLVSYHVDLRNPLAPQASLQLEYNHTAAAGQACVHEASYGSGSYAELQQRCYWDYWRVYRPADTQLLSALTLAVPGAQLLSGKDWPGEVTSEPGEANTQVFSGLLVLAPGSAQTAGLQMGVPRMSLDLDEAGNLIYRLRVQKQAGIDSFRMVLTISGPQGYTLQNILGWEQASDDTWQWTGDIRATQDFQIIFALTQ
ncbi:MAG: DUF4012 domain-containing protein [Anaerolineae bacterium]|nr:DUF4012 domain-containing protein [Anaerolineae bacterium]